MNFATGSPENFVVEDNATIVGLFPTFEVTLFESFSEYYFQEILNITRQIWAGTNISYRNFGDIMRDFKHTHTP